MAKDISELFSKAVDKFRTDREQREVSQGRPLNALERDFEQVKEQVRQLKPQIESHPRLSHFWLFTDKIIISFRSGPNQPTLQLTVQVFHPGNHRFKKGLYGYLPDGYELALEGVDAAVEFVATQCGKLLA
jgi:hypothetical protein